MNHEEAAAAGMVEKYVLGELTSKEMEAFEEHYFCCAQCAADVRAAFLAIEAFKSEVAARQKKQKTPVVAFPPSAPKAPARSFRHWGAIAATLLLGVVGYQNLAQLPALRASLEAQSRPYAGDARLLAMGAREGRAETAVAGEPLLLYVDIPADAQWQRYEIRIAGPEGFRPLKIDVTPEAARDSVPVVFPKGALRSGRFSVTVHGFAAKAEKLLQERQIEVP
jgi:hypothetical protein